MTWKITRPNRSPFMASDQELIDYAIKRSVKALNAKQVFRGTTVEEARAWLHLHGTVTEKL